MKTFLLHEYFAWYILNNIRQLRHAPKWNRTCCYAGGGDECGPGEKQKDSISNHPCFCWRTCCSQIRSAQPYTSCCWLPFRHCQTSWRRLELKIRCFDIDAQIEHQLRALRQILADTEDYHTRAHNLINSNLSLRNDETSVRWQSWKITNLAIQKKKNSNA